MEYYERRSSLVFLLAGGASPCLLRIQGLTVKNRVFTKKGFKDFKDIKKNNKNCLSIS